MYIFLDALKALKFWLQIIRVCFSHVKRKCEKNIATQDILHFQKNIN